VVEDHPYSTEQIKHARTLISQGESPAAVARILNICRATLYNTLNKAQP